MTHIIIDRRKNDKAKSTVNRSRYTRRIKEYIKESARELVRDKSIADILSSGDKKIKIKKRALDQPDFHHSGEGGIRDHVYPGNEDFVVGDKISRPQKRSQGGGEDEAGEGESEDDFAFAISQSEFMDIFFEDLYLPNMVKKDMMTIVEYVKKRAGFTVEGNPSRLNIIRSMKQSMARTNALISKEEKELAELEKLLLLAPSSIKAVEWSARIKELKEIIKSVPFLDDLDLRYNRWDKFPVPSTQAVVFGLMDVSGSMGEWEKDMAKRFFILLTLFLRRKYEKVVNVWITHTTVAKEVDEHEFFFSRESGGTMMSSAYKLMAQIQKDRFPSTSWNVFGVHISDGDNEHNDVGVAVREMKYSILPVSQYFAYVETRKRDASSARTIAQMFGMVPTVSSEMYQMYNRELSDQENFVTTVISDSADIYPVFRKLFEKTS